MASLRFTAHLTRHRPDSLTGAPCIEAEGSTVAEVLAAGMVGDDLLKSYVLDEQGRLRKHVNIYLDGAPIRDRLRLSDAVSPRAEIYVLQALSGG